ncbi:MAG: FAD-binding protein [Campylobacteraceae bacterium]|jgi:flavin-dependent dehydrogenase|nr:FAD-binding protein [Campylobacteraceae bacterium]
MYDIAIIGLGPAGATLARLLDKKYKVIAIDKKNEKMGKCCGGLLSPDAQKILAQFDICLPKEVLVDPQIFSVKTIDLDNSIVRHYQRFYLNMNRAKFDNFLVSLIPSNVEICSDSTCSKIEMENGIYSFTFKSKGVERTEKVRLIIGADGASSMVRKTFYKEKKIDRYVSIQEWYKDKTNPPHYSCIFDKEITDSYCWTISKDGYLIIGGAFPKRDSKKRFEILKEKVKNSGVSFGELVKQESCLVSINRGLFSTCSGKNGVYLIGEAAGMISPSSLEGISYSMESAKILADIINSGCNSIENKYRFMTLGIRIRLILKILKMPFMYNKYIRKLIMKCGIGAVR